IGAIMITVALDAMGGDHAPRAEVEGAVLAAREYPDVRVILVGIEDKVRAELSRVRLGNLPIEVAAATDVVTMTDSPSHAFRRKKDSSLHVAARLVRDGKADALVSAGNLKPAVPSHRSEPFRPKQSRNQIDAGEHANTEEHHVAKHSLAPYLNFSHAKT